MHTSCRTAPTLLPQNQGLEFPYIIPDFQGGLTIIDSRANSIHEGQWNNGTSLSHIHGAK